MNCTQQCNQGRACSCSTGPALAFIAVMLAACIATGLIVLATLGGAA